VHLPTSFPLILHWLPLTQHSSASSLGCERTRLAYWLRIGAHTQIRPSNLLKRTITVYTSIVNRWNPQWHHQYLTSWVSWLGKMAKSLFTLLYFTFLIWTYYTRKKCRKVLHNKSQVTSHRSDDIIWWSHMMSIEKVVHRLCSSCTRIEWELYWVSLVNLNLE